MADAGIGDPANVHYVQTKTPLLTIDTVQDAHGRGETVACEVHESMGVSNGTTGLGIAVALGEVGMPAGPRNLPQSRSLLLGRLLLLWRRARPRGRSSSSATRRGPAGASASATA